ncbi:hypothetical protein K3495_g3361, partial [Podosphaera aphanis]
MAKEGETGSSAPSSSKIIMSGTVEKKFKDIDTRLDNIDSNFESLGSSLASIKQALEQLSNNRTPKNNTGPEYDHEPPSLQAQETLMQQEIKAKARLPDGKINIHHVPQEEAPRPHNLGEKYVQEIWPEVKLRKQIIALGILYDRIPEDAYRIRVVLDRSWEMHLATDTGIFLKLREIQRSLVQAAVPYQLWASKLSPLLDGDFQAVSRYIETNHATWTQALEAIFECMERHGTLRRPVVTFARMAPYKEESYLNFAWRIRAAFYALP